MEETIVNKVAKSPLINIDLEDWIPEGQRTLIDLSQWLDEGLILRENLFENYSIKKIGLPIKITTLLLTVLLTPFYRHGQFFWLRVI